MKPPKDVGSDEERLAAWLGAYDEAVAGGAPGAAPAEGEVPPELRDRLQQAKDWVDVLNQLWPRGEAAEADDFRAIQPLLAEATTQPVPATPAPDKDSRGKPPS